MKSDEQGVPVTWVGRRAWVGTDHRRVRLARVGTDHGRVRLARVGTDHRMQPRQSLCHSYQPGKEGGSSVARPRDV